MLATKTTQTTRLLNPPKTPHHFLTEKLLPLGSTGHTKKPKYSYDYEVARNTSPFSHTWAGSLVRQSIGLLIRRSGVQIPSSPQSFLTKKSKSQSDISINNFGRFLILHKNLSDRTVQDHIAKVKAYIESGLSIEDFLMQIKKLKSPGTRCVHFAYFPSTPVSGFLDLRGFIWTRPFFS